MNIAEMRNMTKEELYLHIAESSKALFEARCKHAAKQLENTAIFGLLRNRISQLQTVLADRQAG